MKKDLINEENTMSQFYKARINVLKLRRAKYIVVMVAFVLLSLFSAYTFISSEEEIINRYISDSVNMAKEYYTNEQPYSEKVLEYTLESVNSSINHGKSLLDGFAGFSSLIFSVIAIACINYTFQISNKIEEYEEKYIIERSKEINLKSKKNK